MSGALQSKHCEGSFSGCELDDGRAGDNNSNKNNNNKTYWEHLIQLYKDNLIYYLYLLPIYPKFYFKPLKGRS